MYFYSAFGTQVINKSVLFYKSPRELRRFFDVGHAAGATWYLLVAKSYNRPGADVPLVDAIAVKNVAMRPEARQS